MKHKQYKILNYFVILAFITIWASCGAGNNYDPPEDENLHAVLNGKFLDRVEGLNYTTESQSGLTDENGTFKYQSTETINFYIEEIFIGQAIAQPEMTPINLCPENTDFTDDCVINMCRFLQALDQDEDSYNGILISQNAHDMFADINLSINFEQTPESFTSDIENKYTTLALPDVKSAQRYLLYTLYGEMKDIKIESDETSPIPAGISYELKAFGWFEKTESWVDITDYVTWSTSNNNIATMNSKQAGLVDSFEVGDVQINASLGSFNEYYDIRYLAPILIELMITPTNPFLHPYNLQQFKAMGTFSDQTRDDVTNVVTWATNNVETATVSNEFDSKGKARALSAGKTQIVAEYNGTMASADITVYSGDLIEIQIQPASDLISIAKGYHKQFHAFGLYSDNTRPDITEQVTWHSNHNSIAKVSKGLVEAIAVGETQIEASLEDVLSSIDVTVTEAVLEKILVSPQNKTIPMYSQEQFTAEAIFSDMTVNDITNQVLWIASNPQVAIFDDDFHKGRINTESPGMTTIIATYQSLTGSTFLTVSGAALDSIIVIPDEISIPLGSMYHFTATGIFEDEIDDDLTDKVTWSSSDITVARVSNDIPNKGLVNAVSVGTSFIRATFQNKTGSSKLTVRSPDLISILISPDVYAIEKGETKQLYATGYYTNSTDKDITNDVIWMSSKPDIIRVINGLIEGLASGQAEISASLDDKSQFMNIIVY
jgi:putative lipoic acid-binding regulatory protein